MTLTVLSPGMSHRVILLTIAVLMPALGSAQGLGDSASRASLNASFPNAWTLRDSARADPLPTIQSDRDRERFQPSSKMQAVGKPHKSAIGWAIAIGIGAGLAASAIAASKYGENEGGEFCGRCFVEWSAITVPVGAGVGFTVGYLIDRSRR